MGEEGEGWSLDSLSRKELQALAKEYGVPANQVASDRPYDEFFCSPPLIHPLPLVLLFSEIRDHHGCPSSGNGAGVAGR